MKKYFEHPDISHIQRTGELDIEFYWEEKIWSKDVDPESEALTRLWGTRKI
jgi:hypothetical protein